jgi:hypothetical protein
VGVAAGEPAPAERDAGDAEDAAAPGIGAPSAVRPWALSIKGPGLYLGRLRHWQRETEAPMLGVLATATVLPWASTNCLNQRQADAGATGRPRARRIGAIEVLEQIG